MSTWVLWICCAAVLLVAGFIAVVRSRRASHRGDLAGEIAAARRAVELAEASGDTAHAGVSARSSVAAQEMLDEARTLLADVPDRLTARRARDLAERADSLWRTDNGRH